jgi:hypothetical protein
MTPTIVAALGALAVPIVALSVAVVVSAMLAPFNQKCSTQGRTSTSNDQALRCWRNTSM